MYYISAEAHQTRSGIYVTVRGLLSDSCDRARITGTYPGTIIHIADPGHAEVFIKEWKEAIPGTWCTEALVPWEESFLIRDFHYKQVAILVNDKQELLVDVQGALPDHRPITPADKDWIVTALVGGPKDGPFIGCRLHHKGDIILAIYYRVFGPDTRANCLNFMSKNCIDRK